MFEIGNSLREARLRQGLDLVRAEADTKIRVKYLQALEEEQFELLPGETYVKGFLRTYANYLRLDGQLYVDEFNSRFAAADEPLAARPRVRRARSRPAESNFVVVALAGIVAVTILVVVAWKFGAGGGSGPDVVNFGATTQTPAAIQPAQPLAPPSPPAAGGTLAQGKAKAAKLILTAVYGPSRLTVHAGSPTGELLYEGTLEKGQSQSFKKKRLWLQLDAAANLVASLNGLPLQLPAGPSVVVVTAKGVETVSPG